MLAVHQNPSKIVSMERIFSTWHPDDAQLVVNFPGDKRRIMSALFFARERGYERVADLLERRFPNATLEDEASFSTFIVDRSEATIVHGALSLVAQEMGGHSRELRHTRDLMGRIAVAAAPEFYRDLHMLAPAQEI